MIELDCILGTAPTTPTNAPAAEASTAGTATPQCPPSTDPSPMKMESSELAKHVAFLISGMSSSIETMPKF